MKSAVLLAGLAATGMAMPSESYQIHETRDVLRAQRYAKREAVAPNANMPFRIALKQNGVDKGAQILNDM